MICLHIGRVKEWGFSEDHNFTVALWDCVLCGEETTVPWRAEDNIEIDHTACDDDCFGCKARGLQLNTGDASRDIPDKKWNGELKAYRDARAQGIQPAGTSHKHIQEAYKASEVINKPYNSETMPKAKDIKGNTVEALKHIGAI